MHAATPPGSSTPIVAVLWDFGGVLTTSPFESFAAYETANGLPEGCIRKLNSTNPDTNAWACLERGEIDTDEFARRFKAEAADLGHAVDGLELLAMLGGELRPAMVEAVQRCRERLKVGLLTNNFTPVPADPSTSDGDASRYSAVLEMFDVKVESSTAGFRKPDRRFYETACELLEIRPEEAVFLDDLGINLKPAREMGMRTIKVTDPDAALAELEEHVGFSVR